MTQSVVSKSASQATEWHCIKDLSKHDNLSCVSLSTSKNIYVQDIDYMNGGCMKKVWPLVALSSALALSSAANAADVSAPIPTWTSVYAGLGLGGGYALSDTQATGYGEYSDRTLSTYEGGDGEHVLTGFVCDSSGIEICQGSTGVGAEFDDTQSAAGFLGRAEIGGDYQFDRIVAGVNASFTLGDRKMSGENKGGGDGEFESDLPRVYDGSGLGTVESRVEFGNSWSIGGRLGYLVTESTLLFGSGGYTQAKVSLDSHFAGDSSVYNDNTPVNEGIQGSYDISSQNDEWLGGYYIGGGVETLLTDHWSLKLEYRFADYGSISTSREVGEEFTVIPPTGYGTGTSASADIADQTLLATISFRM
jgi:opacity protein-like surface antigen